MFKKYICKNCGKEFNRNDSHIYKYCSYRCSGCAIGHIGGNCVSRETHVRGGRVGGKIAGKLAAITNRKNVTGIFNSNVQRLGSKYGVIANRKKGTSVFDPKIRCLGQKISYKRNRRNKTGIFGFSPKRRREISQKAVLTNKKNKTSCYFDPKLHREGGLRTIKLLRKKYLYKHPRYLGLEFDSNTEILICKNLKKRYSSFKPVQNITIHRTVGHKEFDFLVKNTFIDYHPFDIKKRTLNAYYEERRKVLNDNGFKNSNYIVISNIKNFNKLTLHKEGLI